MHGPFSKGQGEPGGKKGCAHNFFTKTKNYRKVKIESKLVKNNNWTNMLTYGTLLGGQFGVKYLHRRNQVFEAHQLIHMQL